MQISGITTQKDTSKSSNGIVIQKSMNSDSYSDSLRNQIDSKQKALESLNENDEMSPKMKIEKRKELQQEIADLEAEIREHELEEKKKEEEKLQKERMPSKATHATPAKTVTLPPSQKPVCSLS